MGICVSQHSIRLLVTQKPYAQNSQIQRCLQHKIEQTFGNCKIAAAASRGKGPYWVATQHASPATTRTTATTLREMHFNSKITQVVTSIHKDQWMDLPEVLSRWTASNRIPEPIAIDTVTLRRSPGFSTRVARDRIRRHLSTDLTFTRGNAQGPGTYVTIIQDGRTIHIGVTPTEIHLPRQGSSKACFRELLFVYVDPDSHWDLVDVVRMAEIYGFRLHITKGQTTLRRAINQAPRAFRNARITRSNQFTRIEIPDRRTIALDRAGDPGFMNEDLATLSRSAVIVGNRDGLDPRILIQSDKVYRFGPHTTHSLTSSQAVACALGIVEAKLAGP